MATKTKGTISLRGDGHRRGVGDRIPRVTVPEQAAECAAFLTTGDEVLLAVGYREGLILIWNAIEPQLLRVCEAGITNIGIAAMAFNPDPEIPVLVVSYQDGSLNVFHYTTTERVAGVKIRKPTRGVYANCIACSPDGQNILIGNNAGDIEIFALRRNDSDGTVTALESIYRADHPIDETAPIVGVAFGRGGQRFADVR